MILSQEYEIIHAGCCGGEFAVAETTLRQWKRGTKKWYCPHCGACRVFRGESDEQRQIRELQRKITRTQRGAIEARNEADRQSRRYCRMRDRVKNGVCPCCNRTFQNFARHMATEHPEFGSHDRLRYLRKAFGLSQADLAADLDMPSDYISKYENERAVPAWANDTLENWVTNQDIG